jgi:hypothetical protein
MLWVLDLIVYNALRLYESYLWLASPDPFPGVDLCEIRLTDRHQGEVCMGPCTCLPLSALSISTTPPPPCLHTIQSPPASQTR